MAFATVFCGALFYALWPQAQHAVDVVVVAPPPPPASGMASGSPAASGPPGGALDLPAAWSPAIVVALLVVLGVVAWFVFGRRKGRSTNDTVADMDADTQSRLMREIGPLFTRQLFD